jgi:uncharacterized damage-inducible protein DinB
VKTASSPFIVGPTPGFSPQIGRLVAMLGYARRTTLEAAAGLTIAQLDHLHDPSSNSIGALLAHITAVELSYQSDCFGGDDPTAGDRSEWGAALELGERARRVIRGRPLEHYVAHLAEVRDRTLRELARRDDAWLEVTRPFWGGHLANMHFVWFHVFEDEISHRGQIRWLRRRLPRTG